MGRRRNPLPDPPPYEWRPEGTQYRRAPQIGDLYPYAHAVWRVTDVEDLRQRDGGYDGDRPIRVLVIPVHVNPDVDMNWRDHQGVLAAGPHAGWYCYRDEHYPICAHCLEPLPCREQMATRIAAAASKRFERYTIAGVCPDCCEPVSDRQKSLTWPDNVVVPGGPPVTFHLRRSCRYGAVEYERRWVAADPEARRTTLSCTGHVTNHGDGTYACTQMVQCPGPRAQHPSLSMCHCPEHVYVEGAWQGRGCVPPANATRVGGDYP